MAKPRRLLNGKLYSDAVFGRAGRVAQKDKLLEELAKSKEKRRINMVPDALNVQTSESITSFVRNREYLDALDITARKMASEKGKPVTVNDIGMGVISHRDGKRRILSTYEPYEIAGVARESRINAYTTSDKKAEELGKSRKIFISKKSLARDPGLERALSLGKVKVKDSGAILRMDRNVSRRVKFGSLDIVSATPSKQADITYSINVLKHLPEDEKEVALMNMVDSTKKGGVIITDEKITKELARKLRISPRKAGDVTAYRRQL